VTRIDRFRIENITFSGNDYRENGRFYQQFDIDGRHTGGPTSALGSASSCALSGRRSAGSASPTRSARRNRLGGYPPGDGHRLADVRSGDIREITWTNVQAIESGGDPSQRRHRPTAGAGPSVEVNDNGDGIAHITDNGDISTIKVTNVDASNNGGAGLRLESDATGKTAADR
jgi:hypothetical protein